MSLSELKSTNRLNLLIWQKSGNFVFHGSPNLVHILKPKQAYRYNSKTMKNEKDGAPAIFATPYVDIAIFKALVTPRNKVDKSIIKFGINSKNKLNFACSRNLITHIKKAYIYILNREYFVNLDAMQWQSTKEIMPFKIIEISAIDLPEGIEILD